MSAIEERLYECEISLDGHDKCYTARAIAETTPHDSYRTENPGVVMNKAVVSPMVPDGRLSDHSHYSNELECH